ncbi:MAG: pyridoxal phosphate-dependent aminotransferase [Planctomycetota bacterium]
MPAASRTPALSRRLQGLAPSATMAMLGRVHALRSQGLEILDLTAGEPDFPPPEAASRAGIEAIRQGRGKYTPAAGLPELRAEAAGAIQSLAGLSYSPSEVVVTSGAKPALSQAFLALVDPGDQVLIPAPFWTSYPEIVRIAEGEPVLVPCDAAHLPDLEALEAARTGRTVALLLNTPCNPTGAVYPQALLCSIGAWALEHGIWVISDEIYAALVYHGARHVSPLAAVPGLRERGVWIGGTSKAYSMTGWRIGFLAAPEPLAKAVGDLQSQLNSCPPAISQYAALAALREGLDDREAMRKVFQDRRDRVLEALRAIPGVEVSDPQGAFYAFPGIPGHLGSRDPATGRQIESGDDLAEVLLEADRVAAIGGRAFGAPAAFRISFAASQGTLDAALGRIAARIRSLTPPAGTEADAAGQSAKG